MTEQPEQETQLPSAKKGRSCGSVAAAAVKASARQLRVGDVVRLAECADAAAAGVLRSSNGGGDGGASASGVVIKVSDESDDDEPYKVKSCESDETWWYQDGQLVLAVDDNQ
eukprot:SAG31_NODE_5364_length_2585_cov_76.347144_2_plen_112_part_00